MDHKNIKQEEHKGFLKFFIKRNGSKQKAAAPAPAAKRSQQAGQRAPQIPSAAPIRQKQSTYPQMQGQNANKPQIKSAGRTSPQRITGGKDNMPRRINRPNAVDNAGHQINRPQSTRGLGPGANYRNPPRKPSAKKRRQQNIRMMFCALLVLLLLTAAVILIVRSCTNSADVLKGTWDLDGITAYRFDGKGKGSLDLPDSSYAFTYEIKDGTLAIDFEDDAARDKTYTFTADKTKLTLTENSDSSSKTFELTKQKDK